MPGSRVDEAAYKGRNVCTGTGQNSTKKLNTCQDVRSRLDELYICKGLVFLWATI